MRIILIGMPACGKTTTGAALADLLSYRHIDTDREVCEMVGCSVARIFALYGEEKFRKWEGEVLEKLVDYEDIVVSSGGGLPCFNDHMNFIRKHFFSVYLHVSSEVLVRRLLTAKNRIHRPLLQQGGDKEQCKKLINRLFEERVGVYQCADIQLDTGENPQDTAEKIMQILPGGGSG